MSLAKMTILGMETWLKNENSSLFKDISLPAGIDKNLVVDTIILKCAEFETYYPDPHYMKAVTEHFFLKKYHTFEEWLRGLNAVYNPIENYDRMEEWQDIGRTSSDTDTKGSNSSKASDSTGVTGSGTTTNTVTTDNSNVYQPDNQTSSTSGSNSTSSTEGSGEMANHTNFLEDTAGSHKGRTHGNIGVTTAPQMLDEFYKISEWNIYDHIADAYKSELCVGVYV